MPTVETLRVIHFDCAKNVLAISDYPGEPTRVVMPMRTIIEDALRLGTVGLLLAHNHPSGDPTPSRGDVSATDLLARTAAALGVRVHDHLVSGTGEPVSFRTLGLL